VILGWTAGPGSAKEIGQQELAALAAALLDVALDASYECDGGGRIRRPAVARCLLSLHSR